MIVSRNGISYNTSDGSQQPHEASAEQIQRSDREQINRWEDDGPGPRAHAAAPSADAPGRPAWSVLSLRNLLEAVRRLGREDASKSVDAGGTSERDRLLQEQCRQDAADAAWHDRYRNHWENT